MITISVETRDGVLNAVVLVYRSYGCRNARLISENYARLPTYVCTSVFDSGQMRNAAVVGSYMYVCICMYARGRAPRMFTFKVFSWTVSRRVRLFM